MPNSLDKFRDHAANERTYLAWVRTGIAVVAFGFVVEKFNIFISSLAAANSDLAKVVRLDRLSGPLGRYEGLALMGTGTVIILLSFFRFTRDKQRIDSNQGGEYSRIRFELAVTTVLVLLVAAYCAVILVR